jgi:hypothetical protein
MSEADVGSVIVHHIDEVESAIRHAQNVMDSRLGRAVAVALDDRRRAFGWDGKISTELDSPIWLAPPDWRIANEEDDNFDLFVSLERKYCIDGEPPATWVGTFCGFAGSQLQFEIMTDSFGRAAWKKLLRDEGETIEQLHSIGFQCNPKDGLLAALATIDRNELQNAFSEDDFDEALAPIVRALERIQSARTILDKLVSVIRRKS